MINDFEISTEKKFVPNCGWIEILKTLQFIEGISKRESIKFLEEMLNKFIPKNVEKSSNIYHIVRLLLQYHDAELCSFLETKKISPFDYCSNWFKSLFASSFITSDNPDIILSIWDFYFQYLDPFFIFFLILVLLINGRDTFLVKSDKNVLFNIQWSQFFSEI